MAPNKLWILILVVVGFGSLAQAQSADAIEPRDADEVDFTNGASARTGTEDSDAIQGVFADRPRHSGRGCPPGTVTSTLSPDSKSLTLMFDQFIVETGNSPGRREVSTCEILVPLNVPAGFRMMVGRIDYRGFALAPQQGRSVLRTATQLVNASGQALSRPLKRRRVFMGPVNQNFLVSSQVNAQPEWSRCGESFQLRIRTDLIAVTNRQGEQAMTALDTIDQTARAQYFIRWKKCDDPRVKPDRPGRDKPGRPGAIGGSDDQNDGRNRPDRRDRFQPVRPQPNRR